MQRHGYEIPTEIDQLIGEQDSRYPIEAKLA
jgi:hypothetical protein